MDGDESVEAAKPDGPETATDGSAAPGGEPPKKGWGRVLGVPSPLLIAGSAIVAVALTIAAFAMTEDGAEKKRRHAAKPHPTAPWAAAARQRLLGASGVRYDGTVRSNDKPVHLKLTVFDGGAASGTLTAGTEHADVVAAGGDTYLKAAASFWKNYGGEAEHAADYAGRWTKAPANLPGLDVKAVFAPDTIAKRLASAPERPSTETVGTVRAYRLKTPRADYLVGVDAPNALLKVQAAGGDEPTFTAADVPDAAKAFADVRTRVAALGGASDPALRFRPGKLTFINCDQNVDGCTVSVPASLVRPEGSPPDGARATLIATVLADGRALGTCTGSGTVPANGSLVLRCTVTGPGWRSWMRSALDDPGAHPYEARARVLGEAVSASRVSQLLAQLDRHRPSATP
ncbi:hypothetical protein [Actinomadura rupiterrae]|uniref:hypothetical protein n=1 Tax=Actinomadura rupiterrae TaxID=559627 RepID=UPI0020A32322|nr:hypothetical protein [Actinomadura rupiterrae]MCP2343411.1 hypothetical protein [Actinomadura rupiterrae]